MSGKVAGILTFHDGINHGAYLQTYALYQSIESIGYIPKVINYKNFTHWFNEYKNFLYTKRPYRLYENVLKMYKFSKSHKLMDMTSFSFHRSLLKKIDIDAIVVGSDEVWSLENCLFGYDPLYFGVGLEGRKCVAYAPSSGSTDADVTFSEDIKKGLDSFAKISVRDYNSQMLVRRNIGKDVPVVLDPAFLHDFDGEEALPELRNFVLVYSTGLSENEITEIKAFSGRVGKLLVSIGYYNPWCDVNIVAVDPFEWLGYVKAASFVVTSMFHGTIFSVKYGKQFALFKSSYRANKFNPMLDNLNLNTQVYEKDKLDQILTNDINYEAIWNRIRCEKEISLGYLKSSIESIAGS